MITENIDVYSIHVSDSVSIESNLSVVESVDIGSNLIVRDSVRIDSNLYVDKIECDRIEVSNIVYNGDDLANGWTTWRNELGYDRDTILSVDRAVGIMSSDFGEYNTAALYVGGDDKVQGIVSKYDISAYSDITLKTKIRTIDNCIDKLFGMRGVF